MQIGEDKKFKKSELTKFAKDCAWGAKALLDGACISEEINQTELGKLLIREVSENRNELIREIAKRFAKVTNDEVVPELDNGDIEDFCDIIRLLVDCCEANNWFKEEAKSL